MKRFLLLGILIVTFSNVFSQVIKKPNVEQIVCLDGNIRIIFNIDETSGNFTTGSHFVVELSDKDGVFSSNPPVLELALPNSGTNVDYVSGKTRYAFTYIFSASERGSDYSVRIYSSDVIYSPVSDFIQGVENSQVVASVVDGDPTEFCEGSEIELESNLVLGDNRWYEESDPVNPVGYNQTFPVSASGKYYVVNSIGNSCSSTSGVIEVTVTHTPTSSIVDEFDVLEMDRDICAPDTYTFYAETNDTSLDNPYFEWLNESDAVVGTGTSFETAIAGTYRLKTINYGNLSPGGGCPTLSNPVILTVHDFEAIIEEASPIRNCEGTIQVLTSSEKNPDYTYRWFKGANEILNLVQPAITYNVPSVKISNGDYTLVVESPGCDKTSDIVNVTFVPIPVSVIDPAINKELCRGDSYTLAQASTNTFGVIEFQWLKDGVAITDISDANEILVIDTSGDEAGDYEYTLITYNGNETCNHISDPVIVTVHDFVAEIVETGPMEICSGEEITLTSREQNPDYTYNWKKNGDILPDPISGIGKTSYTFTSTEAGSGDYTLEIISNGCTKESTPGLTITIKDSPVFNIIQGSQSGCNGDIVTLTSSLDDIAYKYQWYRNGLAIAGETSKSIDVVVNSLVPVEYYLGMSFGNCSVASEKVTVTEVPKPVSIILESPEVIGCLGDEAILNADSDLNGADPLKVVYKWIDAANDTVATGAEFKTQIAGDYRLVTKNENACNDVSSITTVVFSQKAISIISYTSLAECEEVMLTASSDLLGEDPQRVVYRWFDADDVLMHESTDYTDVNLVVTETGIYKLQTLNYDLCYDVIDQVSVSINDLDPEIDEPISLVKVCTGNAYKLLAIETDPTYTYSWYLNGATDPIKTGNDNFYDVPTTIVGDFSYTLRVVSPECDKLSKVPVVVEVKSKPEAIITNGNIDACETDNNVVLTSKETSDYYNYKWYKDGVEIADSIRFELIVDVVDNANIDTKYVLEVTYGESCTETSAEIILHKVITPQALITPSEETVVCDDNTVLLQSASLDNEAPTTYRWFKVIDGSDVEIPGATEWQYDAQATGEYKLEVTNKGVCSDLSDPVSVIVTPSVQAVISPNTDQFVCDNVPFSSSNSINVIDGVTTYQWYRIVDGVEVLIPFATEETYNAKEEGNYFFEAYNYDICGSRSEVVNVKFTQFEHEIEEAPLVKECEGHQIVLHSVNTDEDTYQFTWFKEGSTDIVGKGITYTINGGTSESGNYILEVSEKGAQCVKTSEPVRVVILPDPISKINLGVGYNCEGSVVTLSSDETNEDYDYTWYFNDNEIVEGDAFYEDVNTPRLSVTMFRETEGVYTLKVSIGSCNSGLSNAVMLDMDDVDPQLDLDPGTALCKDGSITITTNTSGDVVKYEWFLYDNLITAETEQSITVTSPGNYKSRVTSLASNCTQFSDEISIVSVPEMGVVEDTLYVNSGESAKFEAFGGDSYVWYDADDEDLENPIQTGGDIFIVDNVQGNIGYQVVISNSYCEELIDLLIISGEITADDIQNIMTPNGDGFNDTWKLPPGFVTDGDEVILLNRQGNIVYKSTNYEDNWRGTFNDGPELPAATYYYVIKRKDEEPIMGSITIFR